MEEIGQILWSHKEGRKREGEKKREDIRQEGDLISSLAAIYYIPFYALPSCREIKETYNLGW
jgi:hypothetical protein